MNKIGSLCQVKKWYWMVFSNKETAAAHAPNAAAGGRVQPAAAAITYYSTTFNCTVSYISPEDIFVLLETDGKLKKLLSSNGTLGWTWCEDRLLNGCFEEVTRNGY